MSIVVSMDVIIDCSSQPGPRSESQTVLVYRWGGLAFMTVLYANVRPSTHFLE